MTESIFVLMPFAKELEDVHQMVFKPIGVALGVHVARVDDSLFEQRAIYDSIIASIDQALVVIADLSGSNPNVFYELGYAHARGKYVVPISSTGRDRTPFDIAGFRITFYDRNRLSDLRKILEPIVGEALRKAGLTRRSDEVVDHDLLAAMDRVRAFAITKAEHSTWTRPAMYFDEEEAASETELPHRIVFIALDALRSRGVVTCVNWHGDSVWMAVRTRPTQPQ
jgi:hypothetical protein